MEAIKESLNQILGNTWIVDSLPILLNVFVMACAVGLIVYEQAYLPWVEHLEEVKSSETDVVAIEDGEVKAAWEDGGHVKNLHVHPNKNKVVPVDFITDEIPSNISDEQFVAKNDDGPSAVEAVGYVEEKTSEVVNQDILKKKKKKRKKSKAANKVAGDGTAIIPAN